MGVRRLYASAVMWRGPPGVFEDVVRPRLLAPSAELLLDALPPLVPQMRFLEVQAGGGVVSRALVDRIAGLGRLVAIDDDMALAGTLPSSARRAARAVGQAWALPFADASFDIVTANLVLGKSVERDELVLKEFARVLKPQGYVIASATVAGSFDKLMEIAADVADGRGADELCAALRAARQRVPQTAAMLTRFAAAGLEPTHHGVCERLLGLYRGKEVKGDPLIKDVVLASLVDNDAQRQALFALVPAIAQTVDGWFARGMPVAAHTVVVTARPMR